MEGYSHPKWTSYVNESMPTNFPNKDSCGQLRKWETNLDSAGKFMSVRFATETNSSAVP